MSAVTRNEPAVCNFPQDHSAKATVKRMAQAEAQNRKVQKIQNDTPRFPVIHTNGYVNRSFLKITWDYATTFIAVIFQETLLSLLQVVSFGLLKRAPREPNPSRTVLERSIGIGELRSFANKLDALTENQSTPEEYERSFFALYKRYHSHSVTLPLLLEQFRWYLEDSAKDKLNLLHFFKRNSDEILENIDLLKNDLGITYILLEKIDPNLQLEIFLDKAFICDYHKILMDISFQVYLKCKEMGDFQRMDRALTKLAEIYCRKAFEKKYS